MDKFFRPSLTDLTRHAFKAEAKKIAEGVREVEPQEELEQVKPEELTDLKLPPRVRIIKEWGEREK